MIMMNSEIHKDRMKPKNIYKDIGRDQWEYANDKYIGTGKRFNDTVTNGQLYNERVQSVGREEEGDESLMRASGQTNAIRTTASFPEALGSPLTEENVIGYNEFSTIQVLEKEFSLGKDLIEKAISNIDQECIERLRNHQEATEDELNTANVFFNMLAMLNNTEEHNKIEWGSITGFNEDTLDQLHNSPTQIEESKYEKSQVVNLRNNFKMKNEENENQDVKNLKEFLCEAFCLIEIVQELQELKNKIDQERSHNQMVILLV